MTSVIESQALPKAINDLCRIDPSVRADIQDAVARVVASGRYVMGDEVRAFEEAFASYLGGGQVITVASGTDALILALRATGLAGKRTAVVANAGMYGTLAVLANHGTPVFVDIEPAVGLMDVPLALRLIEDRAVDGIIVTHLYGRAVDPVPIVAAARRRGVVVIEDCAQAHGAMVGGRRVGTFGDVGCFSFYPTKNLGAMGDGGALATSDAELADALRALRQYGWSGKYRVERPGGTNSRLDEMQAAVLRVKLAHLDAWNARRRALAALYAQSIRSPRVTVPAPGGADYVAHLMVVLAEERDTLMRHLKKNGVPYDIHYPIADYNQPLFRGHAPGQPLPVTDLWTARTLTLPCFPELSDREVLAISDVVNRW